jgi:hypothetical protein
MRSQSGCHRAKKRSSEVITREDGSTQWRWRWGNIVAEMESWTKNMRVRNAEDTKTLKKIELTKIQNSRTAPVRADVKKGVHDKGIATAIEGG